MSWVLTAKVGDKVVAVRDDNMWADVGGFPVPGITYPTDGDVYTIRDIVPEDDGIYFRFEEIRNPIMRFLDGLNEAVFYSGDFRPVRPTDISVFHDILKSVSETVGEDA